MNKDASLGRVVVVTWLAVMLWGVMSMRAADNDTACTLSYLLAPSPALKVVLEKGETGGMEGAIAQVLAKMPVDDRERIQPQLVLSAMAKKARAPHAGTETGWILLDEKMPLILALRYLCELHQCGMHLVGNEVRIYSLDEVAEFPARRYRLSPALASFLLLRKVEAEALKGLSKDEKLLRELMDVLEKRKLSLVDAGPENVWISVRGVRSAHEAFEAEIRAWVVQAQQTEADGEAEPEPEEKKLRR